MLKRTLAAVVGAVLFGIAAPLAYFLLFSMPENAMVLGGVALGGGVVGAILGFAFPKVFGFVFEMIFDI